MHPPSRSTLPPRLVGARIATGFLAMLFGCRLWSATPATPDPDATAPASSPAQNRVSKPLPPPGIAIPDETRRELDAAVAALGKAISELRRSKPAQSRPELLPDIEIFHKAVDWALRFGGFHDAKEIEIARDLLREGRERAAAFAQGQTPWTSRTGLVVRGYRSAIDDSVQPYGMVVPATWKGPSDEAPRATWIWNHGRGDTLGEIAFLSQRRRSIGDFAPTNAFVIHPYGRYCNATKFAGEIDVFEALAAARRAYPVDARRLVNAGFSMGGASAWHLAAHHSDVWAVSHPGAGFAETAEYAGVFAAGKTPPPWWEQVLWRWYDATAWAANLRRHPVLAYHGSDDKQGQATTIMKRFAEPEGVTLRHFVGPGVGHKYEPATRQRIATDIDELLAAVPPSDAPPADVHFVTYSLVYPRCDWVIVTGLERQWERSEVKGSIRPGNPGSEPLLRLETKRITGLRVVPPRRIGPAPAPVPSRYRVEIDGQSLAAIPAAPASFSRIDGRWTLEAPGSEGQGGGRKSPGLCGPIDHAFMAPFLFVEPTGKPLDETLGAWTKSEMARARQRWAGLFRGEAPSRTDATVSAADIESRHLVLWGDPQSNALLRRILDRLPLKWTAAGVEFGGRKYPPGHVPVLIFPNPLNPRRYVVLNSGFTFSGDVATGTNSQQTPKLPDWAMLDVTAPADARFPGRVVDAGFFDERWRHSADRPQLTAR